MDWPFTTVRSHDELSITWSEISQYGRLYADHSEIARYNSAD